jgi:tRNA-modifying protein YgfZ
LALKQDNSSGYEALRRGAGLLDRPATGRILLTGADRRSYLQGLLTNDIAALMPGTGCYAAMLTAQGRMLTDLRVLELGDAVLLDVPLQVTSAIREHLDRVLLDVPLQVTSAIREHLDRFIFSEDVQVEDVTEARAGIGVYGPRALEVLVAARTEGGAPSSLFESTRVRLAGADAILVRSDEPGIPGYEVVVDSAQAEAVTAALLRSGAVRVTPQDVEAVRIESGRPRFGVDMDAETIPLEAGLEERAISRSKGCYVGQEVIVRVQDRGHGRVAKRLVGLTFDADAPVPSAGARIASGERDIGRVTSAIRSPALARPIAMGYVHRDFVEPGTEVVVDGAAAAVSSLPLVAPSAP